MLLLRRFRDTEKSESLFLVRPLCIGQRDCIENRKYKSVSWILDEEGLQEGALLVFLVVGPCRRRAGKILGAVCRARE